MFSNEMQWRWQFDWKWNFEGFEHLKVLTHLCRYAHVASCPLAALQPRRSLRLLGLGNQRIGKFKSTTDANIEYSFIIFHNHSYIHDIYTHILKLYRNTKKSSQTSGKNLTLVLPIVSTTGRLPITPPPGFGIGPPTFFLCLAKWHLKSDPWILTPIYLNQKLRDDLDGAKPQRFQPTQIVRVNGGKKSRKVDFFQVLVWQERINWILRF